MFFLWYVCDSRLWRVSFSSLKAGVADLQLVRIIPGVTPQKTGRTIPTRILNRCVFDFVCTCLSGCLFGCFNVNLFDCFMVWPVCKTCWSFVAYLLKVRLKERFYEIGFLPWLRPLPRLVIKSVLRSDHEQVVLLPASCLFESCLHISSQRDYLLVQDLCTKLMTAYCAMTSYIKAQYVWKKSFPYSTNFSVFNQRFRIQPTFPYSTNVFVFNQRFRI